ncbi:MAG: hypothetical protein DRR42_20070 [Gammaproteobacteria bacterium]|nr:MAG: hypothetical protein DRR42_20070 [Gammaproteobacteria bacterium]
MSAKSSIPEHIANVRANLAEVTRLLDIHQTVSGTGPGRRRAVQVLNKSAVLLLVATWEAYVEDLAILACRFIVENIVGSDEIPEYALVQTSRRLEKDKHDNSIWRLSGDGWKNELLAQAEIEASRLNSPNAENIDKLFENTLGLRNLSRNWYWAGAGRESTIHRLAGLIEMRGEIAHRVATDDAVTKAYVERSVELVLRLGAVSSNRVHTHISRLVGKSPWQIYRHRSAH